MIKNCKLITAKDYLRSKVKHSSDAGSMAVKVENSRRAVILLGIRKRDRPIETLTIVKYVELILAGHLHLTSILSIGAVIGYVDTLTEESGLGYGKYILYTTNIAYIAIIYISELTAP